MPISAQAIDTMGTGNYLFNYFYSGGTYTHFFTIDSYDSTTGNFSGTGYYAVNPAYTWTIAGNQTGSIVTFYIDYTGLNPSYWVNADGEIVDGKLTGSATAPGQTATWEILQPWQGEALSKGYYSNHEPPTLACSPAEVPANAYPDSTDLEVFAGLTYKVTANGTYWAGDTITADAKYSKTERIAGDTWTDTVSGYEGHGPTLLDLQLDDGSGFYSPN